MMLRSVKSAKATKSQMLTLPGSQVQAEAQAKAKAKSSQSQPKSRAKSSQNRRIKPNQAKPSQRENRARAGLVQKGTAEAWESRATWLVQAWCGAWGAPCVAPQWAWRGWRRRDSWSPNPARGLPPHSPPIDSWNTTNYSMNY